MSARTIFCSAPRSMRRSVPTKFWRSHANINRTCRIRRAAWARSLSLIARMIAGGLPTRVYYASQGGFDTHAGQMDAHDRLMSELNDALAAFVADLKQQGNFERVLLLDLQRIWPARAGKCEWRDRSWRGRADVSPWWGSEAGSFGKYPSLTDLDRGDLKFNTDFRSVYGRSSNNGCVRRARLCWGESFHYSRSFKRLSGIVIPRSPRRPRDLASDGRLSLTNTTSLVVCEVLRRASPASG